MRVVVWRLANPRLKCLNGGALAGTLLEKEGKMTALGRPRRLDRNPMSRSSVGRAAKRGTPF